MSDIEKIRQEIERQLEYFKGKEDDTWDDCDNYTDEDAMWYQGHWKMCSRLLSFIDSLPEEKPSEDLEAAANKFAILYDQGTCNGMAQDCFIAGAKWQANQLLKGSPLPEDTVLFQKGVAEGRRLEREDGGLAWQDIKSIVQIADKMLDDPKAMVEFQNHNEEYYYKKVLEEYYDR